MRKNNGAPKECLTPIVDPYNFAEPIAAIESLDSVDREALELYLAEQCLLCVEFCPTEEGVVSPLIGLGQYNNVCPTSIMRAAFIAANGPTEPHFDEFIDYDNHVELPDLKDLTD